MAPLTPYQTRILGRLEMHSPHSLGPPQIARMIRSTPASAAAAASELVRRGLATRLRRGGHVFYRYTQPTLKGN
jgi:DNA-binding MarR family transcriptional regulator